MTTTTPNDTAVLSNQATDAAADTTRSDMSALSGSLGRAGSPVIKTSAAKPARKMAQLPAWAVGASVLWVSMAAIYLALVGGVRLTPSAVGAVIAGVSTPLVVVWLIALLQMRQLEVDAITHPVRRQLAALLAPGASADLRVRRVTDALAEQAEHLRNAANVALEDSSAAMTAITRQSSELRRLSGEAMMDIGKVGKTAEQTLNHLREALAQVNQQTGTERERALALVSDLEKHIREVLGQVDQLSTSYESKLQRLSDTSNKLEERTKILVSISDGVENKVDMAAAGVLGDLDRLEASVAELGQRSAAIAHQLSRPVESLERAASHLDNNMRQSQDMLQSATRNLEHIGDNALSRASSLVATLSDRLSSMELVGAKLVSVGASAQADTGRFVSQIEAAAERVRMQAESGQQQLRQTLREFSQIAENSLNQSESLVGRLMDGTMQLSGTLETSMQRFDALADDIESRAARLRDLGRDANGQLEEARLILDGAQDSFGDQLTRLGQLSDRLTQEVTRAKDGTVQLSAATDNAASKTAALLQVSDTTTATLTSIAGVLTEQKDSVGALASALNTQVETLTAALSNQQEEIRRAAALSGEQGEKVRSDMHSQLQAITGATKTMASQLDSLQNRLSLETSALSGMADLLDTRLSDLVAKVQHDSEKVQGFGQHISAEQETLAQLAAATHDKLTALTAQLDGANASTSRAMEDVAARLVALRTELNNAEANLLKTSTVVADEHVRLQDHSREASATLATTLQRLAGMTGGLESAGDALEAQGRAAEALIAQAEKQLLAASTQLVGNSQTAEMALAGVGDEISQQQQQLVALKADVEAVSLALDAARVRMEAGEQSVSTQAQSARQELEQSADQLAAMAGTLQARVQDGIASLEKAEGSFRHVKDNMVTHTDQVDERIRTLQQDMNLLQDIMAALTGKSDALANSMAQQSVQAEIASGKLQNVSSIADQSTSQLMARMSELGHHAEQQHELLTRLSATLEVTGDTMRSQSERNHNSIRDTLDQLGQAGQQAGSLINDMIERLRSAGTSVGSEAGSAQTILMEVAEALRGTAGEFTRRVETAETQVNAALGSLDTFGRQLSSEAVALQDNIQALTMSAEDARQDLISKADQLANSIAKQSSQADEASSRLQIAAEGADRATQQLLSRMAELDGSARQQQETLHSLTQSIETASDELRSQSAAQQDSLRQTLEQLSQSGAQADAVISQMIQKLLQASSASSSEAQSSRALLDDVIAALRQTADEFGGRVQSAQQQMDGALGHLDRFSRQLGSESAQLQNQIQTLAMGAEHATGELVESQRSIAGVGADVARALTDLVGEIERLGTAGEENATRLGGMADAIHSNSTALENSSAAVVAQQQLYVDQVVRSQQAMQNMSEEVQSVRGLVGQMSDHAAARLAEVSALFAQRIREGGEMVGDATNRLSEMELRVAESVSRLGERHTALAGAAEQSINRLRDVDMSFAQSVAMGEEAQRKLATQSLQNERMLESLTQLTQMSTVTLDEQAQQLARLAQQAIGDSSHLSEVANRIEQQQNALRYAADAAVAVLHSVQSQLHRSAEGSVSLIDAAEAKVSDVLVAMTDRLVSIASQNDALMDQLRSTTERFTQATGLMHESSRILGGDINGMAQLLHSRAMDLTAAGQQFDRDLRTRLDSLGQSQDSMQRYFTGFNQQLAELDTRTTNYLVDLDRHSQESFGRLQTGADILAALPEHMRVTEGLLATQVESARQEIARLRNDLVELGQEMQMQVDGISGRSTQLIANLQDAGAHSRLMAEQIEHASSQMGVAAESAWQAIRSAIADSTTSTSAMVVNLSEAEGRTAQLTQSARSGVEGLLERVGEMSQLLETSLQRINSNYDQLAKGGFSALAGLSKSLDDSVSRLDQSTQAAHGTLTSAHGLVEQHQQALVQGTSVLAARMADVKEQLQALRDGFAGLDARLEYVGPALSGQQDQLEGFLSAVDRTLNQVSSLQTLSRELAGEHLELVARVQESEERLKDSADVLDDKLSHLDQSLSGAVLARLLQAGEQAQHVEGYLARLSSQAGKLDGALEHIKTSLEKDVQALQTAEKGISQVADTTTSKVLEVSTALGATLGQLQKGGQLSHSSLIQTNEETQRLVVRLEQVRALIKNMMGGISTDLTEWQSDMRRRLTGIASELASPAARNSIPPLPPVSMPSANASSASASATSAATPAVPRVRVAATSSVGATSTQLTTEALHAVAVDLYRLLQAEVSELRSALPAPAARRSPMTPQDARNHTLALIGQNAAALRGYIRTLYGENMEFHQYVDRYLARFEAQYDVLARSAQGVGDANAYRDTEVGRLYELIASAIERKSITAREAV